MLRRVKDQAPEQGVDSHGGAAPRALITFCAWVLKCVVAATFVAAAVAQPLLPLTTTIIICSHHNVYNDDHPHWAPHLCLVLSIDLLRQWQKGHEEVHWPAEGVMQGSC